MIASRSRPEELQYFHLVLAKSTARFARLPHAGFRGRWQHITGEVRRDEHGMDVILSADSSRVAQSRRRVIDGLYDVSLGLPLVLRRPKVAKDLRGDHRAGPGPKILRRDF